MPVIKKRSLFACLFFVFVLIFLFFICFKNFAFAHNNNYYENKAIVCVRGGQDALMQESSTKNLSNFQFEEKLMTLDTNYHLQELIAKHDMSLKSTLSNVNPNMLLNNSNDDVCEILLLGCNNVNSFLNDVSKLDCVLWAQPDYIMHKSDYNDSDAKKGDSVGDVNNNIKIEDPLYKYQWSLDKNNYGGSVSIDATKTWEEEQSEPEIKENVVAIIDTGVDYEHPDLKDNMWKGGNIPALKNLGGGIYGLNAIPEEKSTDPMDTNDGHGTHCAGSIAAPFNNLGIRGVNGNNTKILACKFLGPDGGYTSNAIKCFNYIIAAKKNGVSISCISNSWGTSNEYIVPNFALETATTEAGLNGIVSCFSAGNETWNLDEYDNRTMLNPYTITVGSCDDMGNSSSFSNFSEHIVDVFSPGNRILSLVSRYPDVDPTELRYYSWINPEEDNYFHENFESKTPKITLSSHKIGELDKSINQNNILSDKCATIDLVNYKAGDDICVQLDINKSDLQELIKSDELPYLSFMYNLKGLQIENNYLYLKYVDGKEERDLVDGPFGHPNHFYDIISYQVETKDFYKVSGNKVSIEINFKIESIDENASFSIYDFGFGKKTSIYEYMNGTSMACPIVAGIISHIYEFMNVDSPEAVLKEIAYLKGSTVDNSRLIKKSVNPGVVNLNNAYHGVKGKNSYVHPVPQSIETNNIDENNIEINLHGYFFGFNKGSIKVNDIDVNNISSWTDSEIKLITPKGINDLNKIEVTRFDGKTGRNYFLIKGQNNDYVDLPVSDITYTKDGYSFKASDLNPLRMATTSTGLFCLYGSNFSVGQKLLILERYDYETKTWSSIDISNLKIIPSEYKYYYSMASGKDEIYLLYCVNNDSNEWKYNLATYSEASNKFISDIQLDCAQTGDMICNYKGELLLCGRIDLENAFYRDNNIVKIYPDTGKVYGSISNFPKFEGDSQNVAFGNMSCFGDRLYISDAFNKFELVEGDLDDIEYSGPIMYDGEKWTIGNSDMYKPEFTQMITACSYATNKGLISAGILYKNSTDNYSDTWLYDYKFDKWNTINPKFADFKTRVLSSVCHDNNFYVLGQHSTFGGARFAYLPLDKIDAESQNVSSNVVKEYNPKPEPSPQPSPTPDLNPVNDSSSNLTNVSAQSSDYLYIFIASFIVFMFFGATIFAIKFRKQHY